jgi:hypothetical protein
MHLVPKTEAQFSGRLTVLASAVFAVIAAVFSVYHISLLPPGLKARQLQIGVASATVIVDTPTSQVLQLSTNTDQLASLTGRADLVGNLIASDPVRAYIAKAAGLRPDQIQASAPITANVPRVIIEPGSGKNATDIVASPAHYVLQIQADPILPLLHIYAQAPSAAAATRLADASIQGVRQYLTQLTAAQGAKATEAVTLVSLGSAYGGIANGKAAIQIAFLTLITVFAACGVLIRVGSRVRLGWRLAELTAPTSP